MPSHTSDRSPLSRRVSFLVSQIGARSAQKFAERLVPLGLRPSQFGLLVALSAGGGMSQQQLADTLGVHRNVMVGLVDSLQERGLVERRTHPSDRRAHAVHLTPKARDLVRRAEQLADEQEEDLLAGLSPADAARLLDLLQRVADHNGLVPGIHPGLQAD
jgi:DNA-binding MarR family transcriptional regulator